MTDTVLLTLGRLPKGLDIARALAMQGWRVIVAEPHPWHLCRVSRAVQRTIRVTPPAVDPQRYRDDLLAVIEREQVSLVLPVSEETLHVAALRQQLPAGVRLFCEDQERLLPLHDKLAFIQLARAHDLPVPDSYPADTARARVLTLRSDTVRKPRFGCAGRGVNRFAIGEAPEVDPEGSSALIQRFLPGEEVCAFAVTDRGQVLIEVQYRPQVRSGTVAVCFRRMDPHPSVSRWLRRFVAAEGHSGFIGFDFIVAEDGSAQAIECNPRATSGVHFIRPEALAAAILDGRADPSPWRSQRLLQQFFPCLNEWRGPFRDRKRWRRVGFALWHARDVTWQWADPLPLLTMPLTAAGIMRAAARDGVSYGEVATLDIDWRPGMDSGAGSQRLSGQDA